MLPYLNSIHLELEVIKHAEVPGHFNVELVLIHWLETELEIENES